MILDKGINDSNVVVAYRRPRPEWLSQQSFVVQVGIALCILVILLCFLSKVKLKHWKPIVVVIF